MAEFLLKPNDFQNQIDSFKSETGKVSALKYNLEKDGVSLQSLDIYFECVEAMNELIEKFSEFAALDAGTMQRIKAKWMNTDNELATKTLGEILGEAIFGSKK